MSQFLMPGMLPHKWVSGLWEINWERLIGGEMIYSRHFACWGSPGWSYRELFLARCCSYLWLMVAWLKVIPQALYCSKLLLFWGIEEGTWKLSNRAAGEKWLFGYSLIWKKNLNLFLLNSKNNTGEKKRRDNRDRTHALIPGLQTSHL